MASITGLDVNIWLGKALGLNLNMGETPFPWQLEVLRSFPEQGVRRYALDIPTGLGKTAVMAIWLVARALGRDVPRRLVYAVDRRTVVDQATEVAVRLRQWVEEDSEVREALGLRGPLPVSTLRGQFVDNRDWLADPSAPAIIIGTVDMIGSRILFEGYRTSRRMRPYHAGLLGADTLLILDESHLVPAFERMLERVATCTTLRPAAPPVSIPHFTLMTLSATGADPVETTASRLPGAPAPNAVSTAAGRQLSATDVTDGPAKAVRVFRLTTGDREHPAVVKRLTASKHATLVRIDDASSLAASLSSRARVLADDSRRCIVFCARRITAQEVYNTLRSHGLEAELLVGARRVHEREASKEQLERLGFIAGKPRSSSGAAFVVATSAGEVGIDLDADDMVSDLVPWERMVQRFGRVNRRGEGRASIQILQLSEAAAGSSSEDVDPTTERRVEREAIYSAPFDLLPHDSCGIDVSPQALVELKERAEVRTILESASTPAPKYPALTRPLLEAWSLTSLPHHTGRPKIEPWLRGWIDQEPPQCVVVWRKYLPMRLSSADANAVQDYFEAAPIATSEVLETACSRVAEWLVARSADLAKSDFDLARVVAIILGRGGKLHAALTLAQLREKEIERKKTREYLTEHLAGGTLVVLQDLCGLNGGLLDTTASNLPPVIDDVEGSLKDVAGFNVRLVTVNAEGDMAETTLSREAYSIVWTRTPDGDPRELLIVESLKPDGGSENCRSIGNAQTLADHQEWTETQARTLARQLLPEYEHLFGIAGRLHDEGKRARRWQLAFKAPSDGQVYAKTKGPLNNSVLGGYRHEFGSIRHAEADPAVQVLSDDDRDLVLHLIAAHHGFARPVISAEGCEDAPPSALQVRRCEVAQRFIRLQQRFGPWGLAWLEAILRAADQEASRRNDEGLNS